MKRRHSCDAFQAIKDLESDSFCPTNSVRTFEKKSEGNRYNNFDQPLTNVPITNAQPRSQEPTSTKTVRLSEGGSNRINIVPSSSNINVNSAQMSLKLTNALMNEMLPRRISQAVKAGLPVPPEEFSDVSIFFSDIQDFTVISAESSPHEVGNKNKNKSTLSVDCSISNVTSSKLMKGNHSPLLLAINYYTPYIFSFPLGEQNAQCIVHCDGLCDFTV